MRHLKGIRYADRIARERARRELAALCPPHPEAMLYDTVDYLTERPERRCRRCYQRVTDAASITPRKDALDV